MPLMRATRVLVLFTAALALPAHAYWSGDSRCGLFRSIGGMLNSFAQTMYTYDGITPTSLGYLNIDHAIEGSTGEAQWYLSPATYSGNIQGQGYIPNCYRAHLDATYVYSVIGNESQGWGSPQVCYYKQPPPPEQWGNGCEYSPIVLNMGNGPYEFTSAADPVTFDIVADGHPLRIAWTAAGSSIAFLALDRNKNGVIDDGAELFGNHTPLRGMSETAVNGFQALQMFDDNQDGAIDVKDLVWWHLLLWTDRNHDGVSQPDELVKLAKTGVTQLGLDYHWTNRADRAGNRLKGEAVFRTTSGSRPYYDVYFVKAP
jgi:hypothetical protein